MAPRRPETSCSKSRLIEEILASRTPHAILGVSASSTASQLRRAYLHRSRIIHPDKPPAHPKATAAFQRLSTAYHSLLTPSGAGDYPSYPTHAPPPAHPSHQHTSTSLLHSLFLGDFTFLRRVLTAARIDARTIDRLEASAGRLEEWAEELRELMTVVAGEVEKVRRVKRRELGGRARWDVVGRGRGWVRVVRGVVRGCVRVEKEVRRRRRGDCGEWRRRVVGLGEWLGGEDPEEPAARRAAGEP